MADELDTSDMVVVHRALRREFGLLPVLVARVRPGDADRTAVVAEHGLAMLDMLHVHHTGEDELVWPLLLERVTAETELITRMREQHAALDPQVTAVRDLLTRWCAAPAAGTPAALTDRARALATALNAHLDEEEEHILPLAAAHLTPAEWNAVGEHGMRHTPVPLRMIVLGRILEDTTPAERRVFLAKLPPPVRLLWSALGRRQYARHTTKVRSG